MLPSETMIWQPEFTDKTLSRKPGAVQCDLLKALATINSFSLLRNLQNTKKSYLFTTCCFLTIFPASFVEAGEY
ncbi:hypothetical protein E5H11_25815 [Escherichia coli]|nr:hypothetical protein [Escherichia coli]